MLRSRRMLLMPRRTARLPPKRSAEQTRRSVDSVLSTERARIVADMEPLPNFENFTPNAAVRMACHLKNVGRTPAWVMAKGETRTIIEVSELLPVNYPTTFDTFNRWENGLFMPAGASLIVVFYLYVGSHPIDGGDKALWIYGCVEYRDVFAAVHVMRYCFRYIPQLGGKDPATCGFYLDGPATYNQEVDVKQKETSAELRSKISAQNPLYP